VKGKGVGKILMNFALQQALQAKADYLWLRAMKAVRTIWIFMQKMVFPSCTSAGWICPT